MTRDGRRPTAGVGLALVLPTVYTAAGALTGVHAGRAVAAVSAAGWIGIVAGPPLIGALASVTDLRAALTVVPLLTAMVAVAAVCVPAMRVPSVRSPGGRGRAGPRADVGPPWGRAPAP